MSDQNQHLDALQGIMRNVAAPSRFIQLNGLSGVAAGIWTLKGAYFAAKE